MSEFLTADAISYYIENIMKEAVSELYIFFPRLQLSREFYEALKDASGRGVPVIIIYSSENLQDGEKMLLSELASLEIYRMETLNAKCCCNEENILVTSMDMHRLSSTDSFDMGILINKKRDNDLYKKIYGELKSAVSGSRNMNLHKKPVEELVQSHVSRKIYHGFCIKCAMPISYNASNPFCRRCAPKNGDTVPAGEYCHVCGTQALTSPGKPVCGNCMEYIV